MLFVLASVGAAYYYLGMAALLAFLLLPLHLWLVSVLGRAIGTPAAKHSTHNAQTTPPDITPSYFLTWLAHPLFFLPRNHHPKSPRTHARIAVE